MRVLITGQVSLALPEPAAGWRAGAHTGGCVLLSGSGPDLPVPAWAGSTTVPWWSGSVS